MTLEQELDRYRRLSLARVYGPVAEQAEATGARLTAAQVRALDWLLTLAWARWLGPCRGAR